MRFVRISVLVIFVLSVLVFGSSIVYEKTQKDPTLPVIKSDLEVLEVSCKHTDKDLLKGLTAYDEKDGDLTKEIVVGSKSRFKSPGVCNVTYAVFDSNHQPATFTRKTVFKDYAPPKFTLNRPLIFYQGAAENAPACVGAVDMLDGDISSLVREKSSDINYDVVGTYHLQMEVSNSFGDLVEAELPVHIVHPDKMRIAITLKTPLVYVNKGAKFNPRSYVKKIWLDDINLGIGGFSVKSDVDTQVPGVYDVQYSIGYKGEVGYNWLTVIVR